MENCQEVLSLVGIPGNQGAVVMVIEVRNQFQTISDENQLVLQLEGSRWKLFIFDCCQSGVNIYNWKIFCYKRLKAGEVIKM